MSCWGSGTTRSVFCFFGGALFCAFFVSRSFDLLSSVLMITWMFHCFVE